MRNRIVVVSFLGFLGLNGVLGCTQKPETKATESPPAALAEKPAAAAPTPAQPPPAATNTDGGTAGAEPKKDLPPAIIPAPGQPAGAAEAQPAK